MKPELITTWSQRVSVFSFCALVYFLPISTALVEVFSSIIISVFFLRRIFIISQPSSGAAGVSWKPPATFLNAFIYFYFLANLVSVLFSHHLALSLQGLIFKVLEGVVLFFAFVENFRDRKTLLIFLSVFLIGITLIVVNGTFQALYGKDFVLGLIKVDGRVRSTFKHPNDFGTYLISITPWLLLLAMIQGRNLTNRAMTEGKYYFQHPAFVIGMVVLSVLAINNLGLTFSRGAWVAYALSLIVLTLIQARWFWLSVLLIFSFVFFYEPQMAVIRNVSMVSDNIWQDWDYNNVANTVFDTTGNAKAYALHSPAKTYDGGEPGLLSWLKKEWQQTIIPPLMRRVKNNIVVGMGRSSFWKEAWHIINDHPLFGIGPNTYSKVAPNYKINWGGYPHNCYLQMTAETGIIGLVAFLMMLAILIIRTFSYLLKSPVDFWFATTAGIFTGLVGYLFHGFWDTNFYTVKLGVLFWLMVAILVVIQSFDSERKMKGL
jgi:hypothetical protein